MKTLFDELADTAAEFFWLTILFWVIGGIVLIVGGALWFLLQGVVFLLLLLWHGTIELVRYVTCLFRRAET